MFREDFSNNFYVDVAIHDEIFYEKYTWYGGSLEQMAKDIKWSSYWSRYRFTVSNRLDRLIQSEEERLDDLKSLSKGINIVKKIQGRTVIKQQQENIDFLRYAHKVFKEIALN